MSLYRIRNILIAAVIIIAAYVLQTSVFSRIPLIGCSPNLLLIIAFIYGYSSGKIQGMITGLFGGLLLDIFFSDVIGYHALVLMILGFVSGVWDTFFYSDDIYVPLILIVLSDLAYCIVNFIFWHILRSRFDVGQYILRTMLPELLLTFIAGVILYKPMTLMIAKLRTVKEEQI